ETYATVAQWTVAADPLITTHPTPSSTICSGGTVSLTSIVTPVTGPVYTYEWQESNDNGSSDPWATAVGGSGVNTLSYISPALTSTIYYRLYITSSSNGCTTPLISNSALVTVVADPAATTPTITNATVCVGALTSPYTVLSSTASGGTGAYTFQWQYFNGVTWVTASNGTPTGAVYTVAGTTPTSTLTITTAPTTAGTHQYRLRVTQTASGCEGFSAGTTLTVVADPTAPTLNVATPATGSTVCVGATVSATFNVSSNGTGTCTDEYQSTINNGTTWLAYTPGTNLTAGATGTNWIRIQSRRVCSGNGCDGAGETFATVAQWTVVADATAPTATKSPNVVTVCAGATLTLTGPTAGTGGTGTCNFEYRHSTDNGTNWTAWSTTVSSFAAVTGTNLIQIRRNCNGLGCDISPSTQYSWTVVNDPSPPTATQSPVATNVCVGQTLTLTSPLSSNGTGTCNFEYRHSTNNGGTWTAWSTTVSSFAAVAGTNLIEIRRNCNGTGCDISTATQYSWTVSADPTAPTLLAASPTSGTNVCIGDQVSATFNAGSNGTGTCTDNYRYSIDGATTWATYTPGNPITAVTAGTNRIQIQVSRTCDGTNCDGTGETFATVAQWTVLSNITGATFTYTNPYSCTTSNGTVTVSGATGGSGTYQYSINGGASWQASASFTGLADGLSGTVMVRNSTSPNCPVTVGSFTLQEPYEPIAAPTAASNISNLCSSNIATLTASGLEPGSGGNNSGGAYSYNGTNQYYYNASIAGFPTGSVATVEAWVNPVNSQADLTYNGIVSFGPNPSTNYNRFLMSIQSNGVPSFANWNNDFVPTAANCAALPWGQWSHLCMVLNGTGANNISFYINGNLAVTGTTNNAALTNLIASGRITIGCTDPAGGRYFEGSIANVRVWNVARTQAQIQADMYLEVPTVATGLVARYNFNANANCQNNVTYNLTAVNAPASVTPAFYTYTWTGAVPSGSNPTPSTNEVQTSGPLTGTSSMQVTASANGCNSIQSTAVPINDFGGAYTVALEAAGSGNAVNVVLPGNSTGPAYGRPGVGAETSAITASGGGAWDRCVNWGLPVTSNATYGPRVGFGSANTNMSYLAQGQPNSTTNLANGVVCYTASVAPPANRFCLTTTCTSWLSANLNIRVTLTLLTPANAAIPLDYTSSGHIVMRAGQNFKIRQKVEIQAPAAAYYGSGVNSGGGVGCNNYSTAGTWYPILEWYDCIYKSTAPQFYYSFNYNSFPKFTFTSGIDAGPDFTICVGGQPASRIDLQGDLGSLSATCGTLLHFWEGPSGYVNAGTLLAPSGTQSPATFLTSTSPTTFGTYNYTVSQGPAGTSNICYGTSSVNITQNVAVVNGGIWSNGAVGTTYYGTPVPAYLDPTSQVTGNDSWYDNRNWDHCVPDAATNSYILYNATNPANINSNVAGYWGANAATKFLKIDVPNNAKLMINANGTTKLNVTD
ncbi:MAG: LamG domain-containing protein, partial [Bacteroidia bacterium]